MGKFNFGIDGSSAVDEELGEGFYDGPVPPKGIYTFTVKQFAIGKNKNDDYRLRVLFELQAEEGEEDAEYNGYGMWGGYNVSEQSMAKAAINNLMDGIGAKRTDFWAEKLTTAVPVEKIVKGSDYADVLKIGTRKTTGHVVRISCKHVPAKGDYDEKLEPQRILVGEDQERPASKSATEPTPDDSAEGLGEEAATEEASSEGYTDEELDELDKAALQAICDEWEIPYAKSATMATLKGLILKAQNGDEEAAAEEGMTTDVPDDLTEEDLAGMAKEDLVEYMKSRGWEDEVPTPFIPSRVRKLILQLQAQPPF